jgi:hypothetical protein
MVRNRHSSEIVGLEARLAVIDGLPAKPVLLALICL